jgi:hypothetical protein
VPAAEAAVAYPADGLFVPYGVLVDEGLLGMATLGGVLVAAGAVLELNGFLNQLDVLELLDRQPARAAITTRTSAQRTDEIRMVKVSFETGRGAA